MQSDISNSIIHDKLSEKDLTKSKYVYLFQVLVILTIIAVSCINITVYKNTDKIWIVLLSTCLGYLMPEPKFKIPKNVGK